MTTELNQNNVSSMASILASIENDHQVYRWFLLFISLSKIQQKLAIHDDIKQKYQSLKAIQTAEIFSYLAFILILITCYVIKQPLGLLGEALPITLLFNLFRKNRRCVAGISKQFLEDNIQPEALAGQTLFQTCEILSRQYTLPSLVDIITFQDFTGRKVLLASIFFLPFIYPFNSWQIVIALLTILSTTLIIINSSVVLRRLK